jgi:hypothetical protein
VKKVTRRVGSTDGKGTAGLASAKVVVYKTIEIRDGRAIPLYSTQQPAAGTYEIIRR